MINFHKINNFNIIIQYLRDFINLINKELLADISTILQNKIVLELNIKESINKNKLKAFIKRKINIMY